MTMVNGQDQRLGRRTVGVFVVDDHASYRSVAVAVIEAAPGFDLAGSAATAGDAVRQVLSATPAPDLVLADVNLGDDSGVEVTRAITSARPGVKVVLVSALAADDLPGDAVGCGAAGYLPKAQLSPATLEEVWAGAYDWRP